MDAPSLREFGARKFQRTGLLAASHDRPWRNLCAELRSHTPGEIVPPEPTQLEVTMIVRGSACVVRRRTGRWQQNVARDRTVWFCPIGVQEEEINLSADIPEVLHVYLPRDQFALLSTVDGLAGASPMQIAYLAGVEDELVRQICFRILQELINETAGGQMLVESLAQSLAAHLAASYGSASPGSPHPERPGLDPRRLNRVIEFMNANVATAISVADLAEVACLSRHHFSRAFQAATGLPPHRYMSELRLNRARRMLGETDTPIARISEDCQFSSQAAFSRAFLRGTGTTPSDYRRERKTAHHGHIVPLTGKPADDGRQARG